jgi:hypothetical protein
MVTYPEGREGSLDIPNLDLVMVTYPEGREGF